MVFRAVGWSLDFVSIVLVADQWFSHSKWVHHRSPRSRSSMLSYYRGSLRQIGLTSLKMVTLNGNYLEGGEAGGFAAYGFHSGNVDKGGVSTRGMCSLILELDHRAKK